MRIFGFPPFEDRRDAGRRLAGKLSRFRDERPVVFALPRGGVPVGYEISRALGAPLDVFVSRKLGAPGQPEFGIGAVAAGGVRVLNQDVVRRLGITDDYVQKITAQELAEVGRRLRYFRGQRPETEVVGRTAILVDDGLATGVTARARMRRSDRGSLQDRGGRAGLPGIAFGPRGHRLLVQELRADLGRGGRGTARKSQERARRRRWPVEPSRAASTGRWEEGLGPVQLP
jgi:hypothetical protein